MRRGWAVAAVIVLATAGLVPSAAAAASRPTVTGVSPSAGPVRGGTVVTVSGSHFQRRSVVLFGTVRGTNVGFVNSHSLRVTAPPHGAGRVDVLVRTPDGLSAATRADRFTFGRPPVVTGLSTRVLDGDGSTAVTVSGRNLTGARRVMFGSSPAPRIAVQSPTRLVAVAPAHLAGAVDVVVTTRFGS